MKTITIKKSELAELKGLGISADGMAKQFGVTKKEITELLVNFGITKGRTRTEKTYVINAVDDRTTVNKEVTPESIGV